MPKIESGINYKAICSIPDTCMGHERGASSRERQAGLHVFDFIYYKSYWLTARSDLFLKKIAVPPNPAVICCPLCFQTSSQYVTEQALIQGLLAQERLAQRTLYERYNKAMYSTAYRITGDFELAAEVLQDAFLQVYRNIGSFEGRSTIGAWIKAIVVRTALRAVERRKPAFAELQPVHMSDQVDWGAHPIDAEYLEKAILSLPDGYRTVFLLAEVEGYTHREIAEMLGVTEGTSKSQLFAAKKRLRELLYVEA